MNCEVLDETEIEPKVEYDNLEDIIVRNDNVYEEIEKTGIPREVNPFKTLRDFKGDINSLPDHCSNTNIPFKYANSDSDSDTDSDIRSNSSDSSCTYYDPGLVSISSMKFGSDNGDHYTDARSRQTVLRDDVRNTEYHGSTVRINNRLFQNTELLDDDNYYNCDYDALVSPLHFSENGHSNNGSSHEGIEKTGIPRESLADVKGDINSLPDHSSSINIPFKYANSDSDSDTDSDISSNSSDSSCTYYDPGLVSISSIKFGSDNRDHYTDARSRQTVLRDDVRNTKYNGSTVRINNRLFQDTGLLDDDNYYNCDYDVLVSPLHFSENGHSKNGSSHEGIEKTGIPRESLADFKGDINSLPDHSSSINTPFKYANSDSDSDTDSDISSNSSDSSCTYYDPGLVSISSINFGSDNRDHYTDARSRQTVLRDDVRNTKYHGSTVRINDRLFQNTELLDDDNFCNCDYDALVSPLHFSENGHSKNGSSHEGIEKNGIPRESLADFKGDINSLPDHSSSINIPFKCANSDSDSDTDSHISCFRHVRSSNSSDSSCAYYSPGFVSISSMMFGSDNRDHGTDARSRQTVLQDDVRNTNYHGNTEHGHSKNGSSNDSLSPSNSSYCSLNNKQNEHEHRELENNETHTLMSTSENEITGTNIHVGAPLTDGSSDKSQKQTNYAKHRSHHYITKATIANKESEPMNDDDNSSGNTSQTSSTYFITLPCAQSSSLDHDEQLPSRCVERFVQDRVLQHSSNRTSQIVHDASIRPTHPPNSHEGIELYEDFESSCNDKLFSPPSTEMCSQPSTENDDYLTCVYDV